MQFTSRFKKCLFLEKTFSEKVEFEKTGYAAHKNTTENSKRQFILARILFMYK